MPIFQIVLPYESKSNSKSKQIFQWNYKNVVPEVWTRADAGIFSVKEEAAQSRDFLVC